ncbi:SurA N-terminal domain-containing protein [Immundisolibacter sp.]|uniref:SurA N-terminal domain-containing protein n=2 Tax=Immundisolibacter sp. TaxID=1934948 RepID=UPI0035679C50
MLQQLRENAPRWLITAIILMLIVPFALWGVNSYFQPGGDDTVAQVGDSAIGSNAMQRALQQEAQRLRQTLGDAYSPDFLDQPGTKRAVLERLINRQLLLQDANQRRLQVDDSVVAAVIHAAPAFADEQGFDRTRYESQLRRQGLSPTAFENDLRESLVLKQVETGLAQTAFMTKAELDLLAALWFERRDLRLATLSWQKFAPNQTPGAAAIQAYYDAHREQFKTDEQVSVAYLELSLDRMASEITVDNDMLQKRYDELKPELGAQEQRRARHILVNVAEDAAPEVIEQARLKAAGLRDKISAGTDFATLAKTESGDPGSAAQGGDLGFFPRGTMTPAFDEAAFSLAKGSLSEPIRTPFGFHLLEVTDIRAATVPPLAEVRDSVTQRLQRELAEERFFAAADTLRNLAFEHPDTLDAAAEELGLTAQKAGPFDRTGGEGVASNQQFISHAFAEDVLGAGNNSDVFELEPGHYAVLRVIDHTPAARRPLDQVQAQIIEGMRQRDGAAAAQKTGETILAEIRAGAEPGPTLSKHGGVIQTLDDVGREGLPELPMELLKRAFALPVNDGKPTYAGIELASGDYALLSVTGRRPGPAGNNAEARTELQRQLLAIRAEQTLSEQLDALRARHPVKVFENRL